MVICFFFSTVLQGQVTEYRPMISSMQILEKKDSDLKNIEGSPYIENEFLPGILFSL